MKSHFVNLKDGTRIDIKINFGTLYYLQKIGANELAKKIEKDEESKQEVSDDDQMEFTAKVIYAVLRSNGREVTFDEALMLMPMDEDSIRTVISAYGKELKKIKKKQEAKKNMKTFAQK